jgi:GntR family transcriptional regulator of vanillate catabolism
MPLQAQKGLLELRGMILNGDLLPRQRLLEVDLANRLGISRTPIRAALNRLESEGLLDRTASGGFTVRSFTFEDVVAAIEIRGVLEGTVARLAAESGVDDFQLAEIENTVSRLDAVVSTSGEKLDFQAYCDLNHKFHTCLGGMAKSRVLQRELGRASNLPFASPNAFLGVQPEMTQFRQSLVFAQQQHRDLVEAIATHQGARADFIAREHARLAMKNLEFVLDENRNLIGKVPGLSLVSGYENEGQLS